MTDSTVAKPNRDALRAEILKSRSAKSRCISFMGVEIEIRQPLVEDIVDSSSQDPDERKSALIDTLIKHAYVPGTNDRVFEEADIATLKAMPFNSDFLLVMKTFGELADINFLQQNAS